MAEMILFGKKSSGLISSWVVSSALIACLCASVPALAAGPVPHTAPEDQGDAGFCWSYATAGLIEGQALSAGKTVTLSPEYLGFYHLYYGIQEQLPTYRSLAGRKLLRPLVRAFVRGLFHPQEGAAGMTEAFQDLDKSGIVPETVFKQKFPVGHDEHGKAVEIHPTLEERLGSFAENKLLDRPTLDLYSSNPDALYQDLVQTFGAKPPKPDDHFNYLGIDYTPKTFVAQYMQFKTADYQEVKVTHKNHSDALSAIEAALRDNVAVPIGFVVYEDIKTAETSGTFTTENCKKGKCKQTEGGHEVLAIGSEEGSQDPIDALIVKNSWGEHGLNEYGKPDSDASKLGYYRIKTNYLTLAEANRRAQGWSFVVPRKYIK